MNSSGTIPRELEEKIQRELESREHIIWMEQPIPRYFTATSTASFLFAIPWTAFAVFWMFGASGFKLPDFSKGEFSFFPLFGIPFVLIGLWMLSTPLWAYKKAFKTVYVITDKRAITFDSGWTMIIRSYTPDRLLNVYRKEKRDGSGDVIIEQDLWAGSEGGQQAQYLGFLNIRDPRTVENMLKKLASQAKQSDSAQQS